MRESANGRVSALERELEAARSLTQRAEELAAERAQVRDRLTRELDEARARLQEREREHGARRPRSAKKDKDS